MNDHQLVQTLTGSFTALANEVQSLIDRKTILEHKLRFAHEQYQHLADKYAPAVPEVSETLAKLQLPPELRVNGLLEDSNVPLPRRHSLDTATTQHQLALLIREGRKAAQQLATRPAMTHETASSKDETPSPRAAGSGSAGTDPTTTLPSTAAAAAAAVLEQDFTVEGRRKGSLHCPFSAAVSRGDGPGAAVDDPTPHHSSDPICAAMYEETLSALAPAAHRADSTTTTAAAAAAAAGGASKCPIRFLDKHSPEEIAHYVETHKHEIPRSHEICVRRYQRNEEQIRKLDAKYGNLANMIKDLSQLHKPMLPTAAADDDHDAPPRNNVVDSTSHERVERWADGVSVGAAVEDPNEDDGNADDARPGPGGGGGSDYLADRSAGNGDEDDRESRFDRPLKEVRVGESPSRPWGISVPVYPPPAPLSSQRPPPWSPAAPSSPAAPVRMPSPDSQRHGASRGPPAAGGGAGGPRKCPFDHTKLGFSPSPLPADRPTSTDARVRWPESGETGVHPGPTAMPTFIQPPPAAATQEKGPEQPRPAGSSPSPAQQQAPQMVFHISGPVFIGYPMEQAIQFMQNAQEGRR